MGEFYAPGAEGGLRYCDSALGIEWPLAVTELSDKDAIWPPLAEIEPLLKRKMAVTD